MKPKKIPMRMCVGCREMKEKKTLIRVVRNPEGEVSIDPTGKKSGRGAYVCRNPECLKRAIKQKQLERQLEAVLGPETAEALQAELAALGFLKKDITGTYDKATIEAVKKAQKGLGLKQDGICWPCSYP